MNSKKTNYTIGTDNIFQDLGLPDADERLAKTKLAIRIEQIIEERKLKQREVAKILGVTQPKISALKNGQLSGFSMERLIHFLILLNQDIEIIVKSKPIEDTHLGHVFVNFIQATD